MLGALKLGWMLLRGWWDHGDEERRRDRVDTEDEARRTAATKQFTGIPSYHGIQTRS